MSSDGPGFDKSVWKGLKLKPEKWPFRKSSKILAAPPLREYRYINREVIDGFVDQLGGAPAKQQYKRSAEFSAVGPKFTLSSEDSSNTIGYHAKIQLLMRFLNSSGRLSEGRIARLPRYPIHEPPFVYEKCFATPFIVPVSHALKIEGVTGFRIWVSAPDHSDFSNEDFNWSGSYLILTELHFDNGVYHHFYSGCSALRFVVNAAAGQDFLEMSGDVDFGRFDERSIAEKLLGVGAQQGDQRQIETLYRIRYMTDEQYFMEGDESRRVHDVLGYPLFIAVA